MKPVLHISERDNVATALEPLLPGQELTIGESVVVVREAIPAGHKVALSAIDAGQPAIKYGSPIGVATSDIAPGAHVHTHNVASTRGRGDLAASPTNRVSTQSRSTVRPDSSSTLSLPNGWRGEGVHQRQAPEGAQGSQDSIGRLAEPADEDIDELPVKPVKDDGSTGT